MSFIYNFIDNVISFLLWKYIFRYLELNSVCIILTSIIQISIRDKYDIINFISSGYYIYNITINLYDAQLNMFLKIMYMMKYFIILISLKLIKYSPDNDIQNYIHILSLFEILNLSIVLLNYIIMNIYTEEYDNQRDMIRRMYVVKIINATFSTFINMYHIPMYVIKMNNIMFYLLFLVIAINNFQCVRLWINAFHLMTLF
jgi:hypothetical protein